MKVNPSRRIILIAAFDGDVPVLDATTPVKDGKLVFKTASGAEELINPTEIFDLRSRVSKLNGEAMGHRQDKDKAQADLKKFEGIDPVKAREAFDALSKIDQKKLIDAGEVDKVRESISNEYKTQLAQSDEKYNRLQSRFNSVLLDNAFSSSKYVNENIAVPRDMFSSLFAKHFSVDENGTITAKDASGNQVLTRSREKIGQPASFDEAIQILVEAYPNRDAILKGNKNSGSGNQGAGGNGGNKRHMTRAEFENLAANEQAEAAKNMRAGTLVID